MRILQVVSSGVFSGQGAAALSLSRGLRERGHDVYFACTPGRSLEERAREGGLRLVRLNGLCRKDSILKFPALMRALRNRPYHVVHVHRSAEHVASVCAGLSLRTQPVLVRTWHSDEVPFTRSLLLGMGRAHVVTISEAARSRMEKLVPGRASLIRGGTDPRAFHPSIDGDGVREELGIPTDALVVGMSAKLSRPRRQDILLRAGKELWKEFPRLWLLFIGDGAEDDHVEELAQGLGIGERTRCVVSAGESFVDFLACCEIGFLARPGSDGSCRAAMEFMSMAKPLVVCRSGALSELVEDGRTGLVVDDDGAAAALKRLLADGDVRARMGHAGRERVERELNLARVAREHEELYRSLLGRRL